jgi:hypothetical protein
MLEERRFAKMSRMRHEGAVRIKQIGTEVTHSAHICSVENRFLELYLDEESQLSIEAPVEISTPTEIFLGTIDSQEQNRILVAVEHKVDRVAMEQIQSAWQEVQSK